MPEANVRSSGASAAIADPLLRKPIIDWMLADIGVDPLENGSDIRAYVDAVKQIESSGGWNTTGKANKKTGNSALGDYQWFPVPFKEDLEAAERYYEKSGLDEPKWIDDALKHKDPRKLTSGQQEELFMIRMYRLADNEDLRKAYTGDNEAGQYIFATYHHTAVDEDTQDVMDEHLPISQEAPVEVGREPAASALARETGQEYAIPDLTTYANSGMLSDITDLPSRRGGGEILNEAVVPQRSGRFPEVSAPQRGGRFPEVTPTQRGQIPIPQPRQPEPAPTPQLRPQSEPRLESELAATQMATQNGRFSDAQARSSRVNPTPPELPQLEEVVPTQRGQVPIPREGSVRPSDVETNVESKLKSSQDAVLDGGVGGVGSITAEPASPEAILSSPEEVSLGVRITTPRGEKQSIDDFPTPTVTTETESVIPQEVIDVERSLQFEKPQRTLPATQIDFDSAFSEATKKQGGPVLSDEVLDKAASNAMPYDPDRQSSAEFLLRNSARNVANYATLNSFDYIESGVRSLMGEDYDDVFKSIREDRRMVESAYPISQLAGEIGAGGITGNALFNAGKRVAGPAGITSLELGTYMGLSGDTNQERLELATMGSIMGYGLGGVIHLATRPSKQGKPSARTEADDQLDDDWVEQNINSAIKNETTILYRAKSRWRTVVGNNGRLQAPEPDGGVLKRVTPIERIKKFNDKKPNSKFNSQKDEVRVRDESGNEFVVPLESIERVNLTGANTKKFEDTMKFENSNYQFKAPRQVLKEKYNEDGSLALTKEGEEAVKNGEPLTANMVQMEMRDATWRDARTTGEAWDSLVEGGKKLYADLIRGSDDTLYQKVSKQVGNFYQVASTNAGRQTTKDFVMIGEPLTPLSKAIDTDEKLKALIGDVTNKRNLLKKYAGARREWIKKNVTMDAVRKHIQVHYGDDMLNAWNAYLEWNVKKKKVHVQFLSGMRQFLPDVSPDIHIHMSLTKAAREARINASKQKRGTQVEYNPLSREDSALEMRSRGSFMLRLQDDAALYADDAPLVDDYLNPVFTDFRRTANLEQLYQIAKKFNLRMPDLDSGEQAYKVFERIEEDLIRRGINPPAAKYAAKIMSDDFVGSTRTPNGWLQALNSVGYAGSLAGFKSAVLNLHDIPMAAVLYGPGSFKGIANVKGIDITDQGIRQNVGEFRDRMIESMRTGEMSPEAYAAMVTRKGTDLLMNATGFSWFDTVGKNSISKMIVQNAVDTVEELEKRWGFYFDERQIAVLKSQIRKHGTDLTQYNKEGGELMEELFFAGLGQQQLIAMSGRPAAWARHPNFRMMWALRGFAIKQLALAEKNVVDNILEGNIKEAVDYMKRYVIFAAGSFGLLNEARQWMWGDGNFTVGGVLMGMGDQIVSTASINTIGLNDYQWGRMMRNGIALTWLESLIPIGFDIPKDIILNIADAADGSVRGREGLTWGQRAAYPAVQFPIFKQTGRMFDNLADTNLFGIPIQAPLPQPLDDINRKYLLTETGPRESDG